MKSPGRAVSQSVLERLIDDDRGAAEDTPMDWETSVALKRWSVQRDLEWLLNTRRIHDPAPPHLTEVASSVYHFGLPDLSSRSADSSDTFRELVREVEACIRTFEPRLSQVRVAVEPTPEGGSRHRVRFRIEATLHMDPDPERVVFDTLLEVTSGTFSVEGSADA